MSGGEMDFIPGNWSVQQDQVRPARDVGFVHYNFERRDQRTLRERVATGVSFGAPEATAAPIYRHAR
jgi:hypothetical protein